MAYVISQYNVLFFIQQVVTLFLIPISAYKSINCQFLLQGGNIVYHYTIIVWEQEIRYSSMTRDEAFVGPIDTCPSTRVSNSKDIHSGVCHFNILQGNSICVPPRPQSHHSSSDNQMQRKMTVQGLIAKLCPSEKQLSIRQRTDRQTDHEYQIIYSAESI